MYLSYIKTQTIKALKDTFSTQFPDPLFRDLRIDIEYPYRPQEFPSIWIDYEPDESVEIVGIGHDEFVDSSTPGNFSQVYRWRFSGSMTFTAIAMKSLQRDMLVDALIATFSFSKANGYKTFRDTMEAGDLIGVNMDFDAIHHRGFNTQQGTPWGTDEMMYEGTVALKTIGEYVSVPVGELMPLSNVHLFEWIEGFEGDPTTGNWSNPP